MSGVIVAVITWFVSRRLNRATVAEKEANALATMIKVSADLARQVQAFADEVPNWKSKIAVETARAEKAEHLMATAKIIHEQARIIVEEAGHLSYMKAPDEEETVVEQRFKNLKAAAKRIREIEDL